MAPTEADIRARARTAVQGLQAAVDSIQKRYDRISEKRNLPKQTDQQRQDVSKTMKRISAWLTALLLKQTSLKIAMHCLIETAWPTILQALERELQQPQRAQDDLLLRISPLLQNLFTQLIRLHDGLILCISGECRHKGDVKAAKQTKYPSQLNLQGASSDGVTRLYSSDLHYSGESWDEFHDPKCGIKQQLLKQLGLLVPKSQHPDLWDALVEKGAMSFEAVLDEIQNERDNIQLDCTSFKHRINSELKLLFQKYGSNIHVDLRLPDKMEKFRVKMDALQWKFERFANTFQVLDPAGALPLLFTEDAWRRILTPTVARPEPTRPPSKARRKVILDSSESEDDVAKSKPAMATAAKKEGADSSKSIASGLVVKVQQVKPTNKPDDEPASVNEIKQQMGVDVEQLVQSRQMVEEEEAAARRAADKVDDAPEDMTDLETSMNQVRRLQKVLTLAKLNCEPDETIWNAQEFLREAYMNAGNACLDGDDSSPLIDVLKQAITYFDEARSLCRDQQALLQRMKESTSDPEFSYESVRQRYVLLLGRAKVNSGIARVEISQHISHRACKRYEREARKHLESALDTTKQLIHDIRQCGTTTEAIIDLVNTFEVSGLALLWIGKLQWLQWQRLADSSSLKSSVDFFQRAASALTGIDPADTMFDDDLFEATLKVLVQEYHAMTIFADLAVAFLEEAQGPDIRECIRDFDYISDKVVESIETAASKSRGLYGLVSISQDTIAKELYLKENGILSANDLLRLSTQLRDDWKSKRDLLIQPLESTDRNVDMGRSDVPTSDLAPARPFSGRIVLNGTTNRKKKQKPPKGHSKFGASRRLREDATDETPEPAPKQYLPWGDDLLPQTIDEHGRSVPKLEYPAIAPELPAELKARWEELQRQKAAARNP